MKTIMRHIEHREDQDFTVKLSVSPTGLYQVTDEGYMVISLIKTTDYQVAIRKYIAAVANTLMQRTDK